MTIPPADTPFVGRGGELAVLRHAWSAACAGEGGVLLIAGEPGVGKTRLAVEFALEVEGAGATALWGTCFDGEWSPPYGPFAASLAAYFDAASSEEHLGMGATAGDVLSPLIPGLDRFRPRAPSSESQALSPNEQQVRALDAVNRLLSRMSEHAPVCLFIDDLHWADRDSLAMLRYVARFAPRQRLLLVGTYRDAEVGAEHPMSDCLASLYRESRCERMVLAGLGAGEILELATGFWKGGAEATGTGAIELERVANEIERTTGGNPFFATEILRNLVEEARIYSGAARTRDAIAIPDSVRQVMRKRSSRLGAAARAVLLAAAAFAKPFRLDVAAAAAGVGGLDAVEAVDRALRAQLLVPGTEPDTFGFAHALVRDAFYDETSPARRARLHRRIAETMEQVLGDRARDHPAEIAHQYHRSRSLPGAERGAVHALLAAEQARSAHCFDEVARQLRVALDLLPAADETRVEVEAKLAIALCATLDFEAALRIALHVAERTAARRGTTAAAGYLAEVVASMNDSGGHESGFVAARKGLEYAGDRRDVTWAVLAASDVIGRETRDPHNPGIPLDSAERREIARILAADTGDRGEHLADSWIDRAAGGIGSGFYAYDFLSRREMLARGFSRATWALGDYREGARLWRELAELAECGGRLSIAVGCWSSVYRFRTALGELDLALEARERGADLARRAARASAGTAQLFAAEDEWRTLQDQGWDQPVESLGPGFGGGTVSAIYRAALTAASGRIHARMGRTEKALERLAQALPAIEQAPFWAENYVRLCSDAAEILWWTLRTDGLEVVERSLRDKVLRSDFRYPMNDSRLSLARLCALREASDEAVEWFDCARVVLDEQGARPLRAIVDHDEGLMYARRAKPGDVERARPLLEAALRQFRSIGMPGWIRRAEILLAEGREANASEWSAARERAGAPAVPAGDPDAAAQASVLRRAGEIWTIAYEGRSIQLKPHRGLDFLAFLLARPGAEVHALELVSAGRRAATPSASGAPAAHDLGGGGTGDAGVLLDPEAVRQYRARVRDLQGELEEATANADLGRVERLRNEIEFLSQELRRAIGLGGRSRRAGSAGERARVNVTRAVGEAIRRIERHHPALGAHLRDTVRTGTTSSYRPDARLHLRWET